MFLYGCENEEDVNQTSNFFINYLSISPIYDEEWYWYLEVDENIPYNGISKKTVSIKNITGE